MLRSGRLLPMVFWSLAIAFGLTPLVAAADVVTAVTSSGLGTVISPPDAQGKTTTITGGTRHGENLFHSFGQFSVATGDIANFLNTSGAPTANILSRVTGGDPSEIYGTIRVTHFGGAHLFFMNPAGVIFGPEASLDISGSFHVTTADALHFADGARFTAAPNANADALLTTAAPQAFGFLSLTGTPAPSVGSIQVHGTLEVDTEETISIVARDVSVDRDTTSGIRVSGGTVAAPQGLVHLVTVSAAPTTVPLTPARPETVSAQHLGDITLTDTAQVSTDGPGGGTVVIRGGQLRLEGNSTITAKTEGDINGQSIGVDIVADTLHLSDNGTLISSNTEFFNNGDAGDIVILARQVTVEQNSDISSSSLLSTGDAGDIHIEASESLLIDTGGQIFSQTAFGDGHGGDITLTAPVVTLAPNPLFVINTQSETSTGDAGDVTLNVDQLNILGDAAITTRTNGEGRAGDITVTATLGVSILTNATGFSGGLFSDTTGPGAAGNITLNTAHLTISNGGRINSTSQGDLGRGGTITVQGPAGSGSRSEAILIASSNQRGFKSRISTITEGLGNAGDLRLHANDISVLAGGDLTSQSTSGAADAGAGGAILLEAAHTVTLEDSTVSTSVAGGSQPGGDLTVRAGQRATLTAATVTTHSAGLGPAGAIHVDGGETLRLDQSAVTADAQQGFGGAVTLEATDLIYLTESEVATRVQQGSGSAGRILIDPDYVIAQNSVIDTSAVVGDGGDVDIIAHTAVLIDAQSVIDTSSQFGGSGTVDVRAPIQQLSGVIVPLPEGLVNVSTLYAAPCAAQKDGRYSSFVNAGAAVAPRATTPFLPAPLPPAATTHAAPAGSTSTSASASIPEASAPDAPSTPTTHRLAHTVRGEAPAADERAASPALGEWDGMPAFHATPAALPFQTCATLTADTRP